MSRTFDADGGRMGQVGDGARKDIRDAVEAAHAAAGGWGKRSAHDRSQICFYIAENLEIRRAEIAARISKMTGAAGVEALKEVGVKSVGHRLKICAALQS